MTQIILLQANYLQKAINLLLDRLEQLRQSYLKSKAAARDAAMLRGLSDRELNDMGISRCDINRICYEHQDTLVNENLKGHV